MAGVIKRFGAVAKHGGQFSKRDFSRSFNIGVEINRNVGASPKFQYRAAACVTKTGRGRPKSRHGYRTDRRCGSGSGRTPTAAAKKALRRLSTALK
jgi:hypothetical protein